MATIYDVARRAEVSAATVSRVLNGGNTVDPKLAERVIKAAGELRYRPNSVARNLRKQQTRLIAVIISDVRNPFFTSMVRGIEDVASAEGYSVVLCNTDEDPDKESQYIAVALSEQMAGVVISPSADRVEDINLLVDSGCPVVLVDRELEGVRGDVVATDNERGAGLATRHLVEQGRRRIACITGPRRFSTAEQRLRGYLRALGEAGIEADEALVRSADFREGGGYEAMVSLLDRGAALDAVFATNNLMTVGAMRCLAERGLAVPGDVAVVGFDAIPWAELVRPSITTVEQPTYQEGRRSAELLMRRIREPAKAPVREVLAAELRVRDSSVR